MHARLGRPVMLLPAFLLLVVVFYLPLARLLARSVVDEQSGALTVAQYQMVLSDQNLLQAFWTSNWMGVATVVLTLVLAYPLAYTLAAVPPRVSAILFIFVLVPFWTSLTVRMFAFWLILGRQGPVNAILVASGLTDEPLTLLFTSFSVLVGFVHVGLPLMVFPLYAAMRGIDRSLLRAANSLGASPLRALWHVFLPLSLPGVVAGATLVFVTTVGYFVVPMLLGGKDQNMIGQFIINEVQRYANLPLAAAMTAGLLAVTVGSLVIVNHFVRLDQLWSRGDEGASR